MEVFRNRDGQVFEITISGHSGYDAKGKDIVCAAVSGISFGMINAVEMILGIEPEVEMDNENEGFLRCRVPQGLNSDVREKVELLMEAMVCSLQSVADEYGQHVRVYSQNKK